ncbi:MAG: hypothetical protein IJ733_14095 [Lachnospiraceae bacterium]|nr:hypothetical protein [Lachnospiraceae bacterium]
MKSSALPTVFIGTETGSMEQLNADKTNKESGKIMVLEEDGTVSYHGNLSIRGRGNSTYSSFEKKPFNIKLENGRWKRLSGRKERNRSLRKAFKKINLIN